MAELIRMRKNDPCDISRLADILKNDLAAEFICEGTVCGGSALLICFEQYYFRASNYVSLTVLISCEAGGTAIKIVGSGGGDGLLNISWGANRSLARKAKKVFLAWGFTEE